MSAMDGMDGICRECGLTIGAGPSKPADTCLAESRHADELECIRILKNRLQELEAENRMLKIQASPLLPKAYDKFSPRTHTN